MSMKVNFILGGSNGFAIYDVATNTISYQASKMVTAGSSYKANDLEWK
jgi:hypothetical protein